LNLKAGTKPPITKQKNLKMKKISQSNTYVVYDSMGRRTNIYIIASNIKEAYTEAKKRQSEIKESYYKIKRAYNGGVKGSEI
jgi:hypothetical protein